MTNFRGFRLLAAAVLAVAAAGCESPPLEGEALVDEPVKAAGKPRVVVAVIDSGINPYHSFFNEGRPGLESRVYPRGSPPSSVTPEVLAEFGIDEDHILALTRTGDPEADFAADADLWANVQPGEPYWFRGTNIIAIGRDVSGPLILPDDTEDAHGVAVTAAVLAANPDAVIYFVEQESKETTSNDVGSSAAHAEGFLHPAVDIVSTSYGLIYSLPDAKPWYHTFESVVLLGKLHFSSAGNEPTLTSLRGGSGPWWSIGVSGIYEYDGHHDEQSARDTLSSYFPDFVADYQQSLPLCATCQVGGDFEALGTSVAAARAAGVASRVLLEARRQLGHSGGIELVDGLALMAAGRGISISNWQLRRALEQAAFVPTMDGYDPTYWPIAPVGLPVNPVAPWLEVGWGELSADPNKHVVSAALGALGLRGKAPESKDPGFCEFQTKLVQFRHARWDLSYLIDSVPDTELYGGDGTTPPAEDPFIYCGASF